MLPCGRRPLMNDPVPANDPRGLDPALAHSLDEFFWPVSAHDSALIARVKARVMEAIGRDPLPANRTVRADSGGWERITPKIERKVLWSSDAAISVLLRCAPGAEVGPHLHAMDEECMVLEGSIRIGDDLVLHAGDFHVGRRGSRHAATTTDTGALVYLRGARDEGSPG